MMDLLRTERRLIFYFCLVLVLSLGAGFFMSGCLGREPVMPKKFDTPIESRLILHVPYYAEGTGAYSHAALAALMTFHGQPLSIEGAGQVFGQRRISPRNMVGYARKANLKADFFNGTAEDLVEAVRKDKPLIVWVGADAGPLRKGDYAVLVGYTQAGVVVNSTNIHQQIVDWSDFLTAWFQVSNFILKIEPF